MQGDSEIDVAGLHRGGSLHAAGRHVVEHDDVDGTLGTAGRSFPGDRLFDQPQAVLDVRGQADEVRNHGAVGVVAVAGRPCDAVACCILHECTP
jgi:hypothetical protein